MQLNFKISMEDAGSDHINKKMAEFTKERPIGLSIIMSINQLNQAAEHNINQIKQTAMPVQLIIAAGDEAVNKIGPYPAENNIAVAKGIERAKLHIKYSHFIIIDQSQEIHLPANMDIDWQQTDVIMCDLQNSVSVDGRIYQSFFDHFSEMDQEEAGIGFFGKTIKENVLLLPSKKMFSHIYDAQLSFRSNMWLQQLFALVSLGGEVKHTSDIALNGSMECGPALSKAVSMRLIKHVDQKLQQRYDKNSVAVLKFFNQQFTLPLKNAIDKGEVSKAETIEVLKNNGMKHIDYSTLNQGDAHKLVLAYCFPPFNDTSGNVMAKRIAASGEIVDIISNNMDRIRKRDDKLLNLVSDLLDTQIVLDGPQAFSSGISIERFTEDGFRKYLEYKDKYSEVYSRAMFPHSHFLGYRIKAHCPDLKWIAEFSDPLHKDVNAEERYAPLEDDVFLENLYQSMDEKYHHLINDNVFNLSEVLPFIYADELIFTNKYQLEYMLERFDEAFREMVKDKAVISQHPTPPKHLYQLVQSYYKLDNSHINLAYFGNFYSTRGFRQIELLAKQLYDQNFNNFTIHVFTSINRDTMRYYKESEFKNYIRMNPYVSYFEFLNLSDKMDMLIIFDAQTIGIKPYNPYVPSKLSDYRGSDSYVWAFTEAGSILDETIEENIYTTRQYDYHRYKEAFKKMAAHLKKDLYRASQIECMK